MTEHKITMSDITKEDVERMLLSPTPKVFYIENPCGVHVYLRPTNDENSEVMEGDIFVGRIPKGEYFHPERAMQIIDRMNGECQVKESE